MSWPDITTKPCCLHRQVKKACASGRNFELHHAAATLGVGQLGDAVKLPPGQDLIEWLAMNVIDFFSEVSLLYGCLQDVCTSACCPVMTAGPRFEYKWADGQHVRRPLRCSAPKYVELMMEWAQATLEDESIFPTSNSVAFPKNIRQIICCLFKRLFRVYAHMYVVHFGSMQEIGAEAHLNTCFRQFVLFVREFDLIEQAELAPLRAHIDKLLEKENEGARLDHQRHAHGTAAHSAESTGGDDGSWRPPCQECSSSVGYRV